MSIQAFYATLVTGPAGDMKRARSEVNDLVRRMPVEYRHLVVHTVPTSVNLFSSSVFLPDGSKDDRVEAVQAAVYRDSFAQIYADSCFDVVQVRWGGDAEEPEIHDPFPGEDYD